MVLLSSAAAGGVTVQVRDRGDGTRYVSVGVGRAEPIELLGDALVLIQEAAQQVSQIAEIQVPRLI